MTRALLELATEASRRWFEDATTPSHVQDSENSVYSFDAGIPARRLFLRLTDPEHRSYEQISAELDFVLYLSQEGCRVSRPVSSRHDRLIEWVSADNGEFFACVFEGAPGQCVPVGSNEWGKTLFVTWGNFMGRMHRAAKSYAPKGPKRRRWNEDDVLLNATQHLPATETSARLELERVLAWLTRLPSGRDRFGLIHGDLCRVNFHYDGKDLIAFDFDDSCFHWFLYDLVCALAPATFQPPEERRAYRRWMVQGYEQVEALPEGWQEEFDWLLRLRSLYIFILYVKKAGGGIQNHPKRRLLELLRNSFDQPVSW
jgi:Ser/Thr protein kinase RdoA (MazF antagonist)